MYLLFIPVYHWSVVGTCCVHGVFRGLPAPGGAKRWEKFTLSETVVVDEVRVVAVSGPAVDSYPTLRVSNLKVVGKPHSPGMIWVRCVGFCVFETSAVVVHLGAPAPNGSVFGLWMKPKIVTKSPSGKTRSDQKWSGRLAGAGTENKAAGNSWRVSYFLQQL